MTSLFRPRPLSKNYIVVFITGVADCHAEESPRKTPKTVRVHPESPVRDNVDHPIRFPGEVSVEKKEGFGQS